MFLLTLFACTGAPAEGGKAPSAPLVAITPGSPTTTDDLQVTVQGGGADPDGDPVRFGYAWFRDGADAGQSGTTVSAELTARDEVWKVVVTPSDGELEGEPGVAEVTIGDAAPEVQLALDPLSPTTADEVTVTPSGEDADGDTVVYTWEWTRDGVPAGILEPVLPAGVHHRGEVWEVTATPSDGTLDGAPATVGFTVQNAPPVLGAVSLSPVDATVEDTLEAVFTGGEDADGDELTVAVEWWVDGVVVATDEVPYGTAAARSEGFTRGARVHVVALPSDGLDDGAAVSSAEVVIGNAAPSATGATITPNPATTADSLSCVGEGWADPDGDAAGWRTRWTLDGVEVSTEATLAAGTHHRGEVVGCTLTPWDGADEGPAVTAAAVTVQNAPPTCDAAAITIGPEPATIASVLSIQTDGYVGCADADGDALTRTYAWTVDGVPAGTGATLSAAFTRGQSVVLGTAWTDGDTSAAAATSNVVVITNQAPVVADLSLSPVAPTTDDTLSATVRSTDLEGDTVTLSWAWSVDGVPVSTAETLDGAWFDRDQVVDLTVTPYDGADHGAAVGVSAVILNSPPGAPGLDLSPSQVEDDDDLVCVIAVPAADADADPVDYSFTWEVDGVAYTGATSGTTWAGDTVPAAATALGQRWTCEVLASDGTDTGPAASVSTVVGCDRDGDGYADTACGGDDCDDADATRNPGTAELCDDADVDEDCDGLADDADPSVAGTTWYRDADNDGYGVATTTLVACSRPGGYRADAGDCDDFNSAANPGRSERCDNIDVDEDCDGLADDLDPEGATGKVTSWVDADGDGYGDSGLPTESHCSGAAGWATRGEDCDEADADRNPGEAEVCNDGIDNDCDPDGTECGIAGSMTTSDAGFVAYEGSSSSSFGANVAAGDFDGDGYPDLAGGDIYRRRVTLYRGPMGTGSSVEYVVDAYADATITGSSDDLGYVLEGPGDVDGDGFDDLVTESYSGGAVYLIRGSSSLPDQSLGSSDDFLDTNIWSSLVPAGDFNGDGFQDMLIGTYQSSTFSCELWTGGGAGLTLTATWGPTGYWCAGSGADGRDFDGDGLSDLAFAVSESSASNSWATMFLAGDTSPVGTELDTADAWVSATDYVRVSAAGDIDGDGYEDLAVANTYTQSIHLYLGPPATGLGTGDAWASGTGLEAASGDTDGDGADELYLVRRGLVYRYALPLASGSFPTAEASVQWGNDYMSYAGPVVGTDISADGYGDLVLGVSGFGTEGLYMWEGGRE